MKSINNVMKHIYRISGWFFLLGGSVVFLYRNIMNFIWVLDKQITPSAFWVWLIFSIVFCGAFIGLGAFLIKRVK